MKQYRAGDLLGPLLLWSILADIGPMNFQFSEPELPHFEMLPFQIWNPKGGNPLKAFLRSVIRPRRAVRVAAHWLLIIHPKPGVAPNQHCQADHDRQQQSHY